MDNITYYDSKFADLLLRDPKTLFVLWLISNERMYGYKILSKVNKILSRIPGDQKANSSSLYPILHRLEKDDLIVSHDELNGNRKVKLYNITDEGETRLRDIKYFLRKRPENNVILSFVDDMFFGPIY